MKRNCGIYKITNIVNGKSYVGQSVNVVKRLRRHLSNSIFPDSALRRAIAKYGLSNFVGEILLYCDIQHLDYYEVLLIKAYNCFGSFGYNMTSGGCSQAERSLETRNKLSISTKARWAVPENKAAILSYLHSEEAKAKRVESRKQHHIENPEKHKQRSDKMKTLFSDVEFKERNLNQLDLLRADAQAEEKRLKNFRLYWSDEDNKQRSVAKMQGARTEEVEKLRLQKMREFWDSEESASVRQDMSERMKKHMKNPENVQKTVDARRKLLADPELKDALYTKIKNSWDDEKRKQASEITKMLTSSTERKIKICFYKRNNGVIPTFDAGWQLAKAKGISDEWLNFALDYYHEYSKRVMFDKK